MNCVKDKAAEPIWNNQAWSELSDIAQQCTIGARYRDIFKVKSCDSSVISLDG